MNRNFTMAPEMEPPSDLMGAPSFRPMAPPAVPMGGLAPPQGMDPNAGPPAEARGGLASRAVGGLSKFLGDVERGIELVTSHPLYQRAWSGFVSGAAGDPMAGPNALANLKAAATQEEMNRIQIAKANTPTVQDELAQMRLQAYKDRQLRMRELQAALNDSDPNNDRAAFERAYPEEALKQRFAAPKTSGPKIFKQNHPDGSGMTRNVILTPEGTIQEIPGEGWHPPSGGIIVGMDENGNPIVRIGGSGELTNSTQTQLEKDVITAEDGLARLDEMDRLYQPEFQTLGKKFDMAVISGKARFNLPVSPEEQAALSQFTMARANAFNYMNKLLHQLSGAAIGVEEAQRLMQALPNPGTGLFDGDDWVTFQAKMDAVKADLRSTLERNQKRRQSGQPRVNEPTEKAPEGFSPHPTIPGFWVHPDGRGWMEG